VTDRKTRVLVVRGHQATPWELRSWELLPERFDVRYLRTKSNPYGLDTVSLEAVPARTMRDLAPAGRLGDLAAHVLGDRYRGFEQAARKADIVHAEELSYWFAAEAARHKRVCGYKLVLTVWETLPLLEAFRNAGARRRRRLLLEHTDLYLPTTDRARAALLLEGVPGERIVVSPPGIDVDRFRSVHREPSGEHVFLSVGRLVWEKGHQDLLRAAAAIREGVVSSTTTSFRVRIVGDGPERSRLEAHARELGLERAVEFLSASYGDMPRLYAEASCLILPSLPSAACSLGPFGVPRCFWEEQFGMVLVEAMAAGLPIVASTCGAIPEVTRGRTALVAPGDWVGLARALAEILASRPANLQVGYDQDIIDRCSQQAAAGRLAAAYDLVTAAAPVSPGG
jgi:glycosyltransferase involved in cell wall biosynthesis